MPHGAQFAVKDEDMFRGYDRYMENELARTHKDKVKINGLETWNRAPARNYPDWVKAMRAKVVLRKSRGRKLSWGTWYIFTFPDWTQLDAYEKRRYANELIRAFDAGSCGKAVWHDKYRLGAHDFNMLISPVALHGHVLLPRRNSSICEYRRLQRVSDLVIDELNLRRQLLHRAPILTMREVQERQRRKKKRKTLAEIMADTPDLLQLLKYEASRGPQHLRTWRWKLVAGLEKSGCVVEHWDLNSWEAQIQMPGLFKAQDFHMVGIIREALEIAYQRNPDLVKKVAPNIAATPPTQTRSGPTAARATQDLSLDEVLKAMGALPVPTKAIANSTELGNRLAAAKLTCASASKGEWEISDASGRKLRISQSKLFFAVQCQVLYERLYQHEPKSAKIRSAVDLHSLSGGSGPSGEGFFALPDVGECWDEAFDVVSDAEVRKYWKTTVESTMNIPDSGQRLAMIRWKLDEASLPHWTQFIFLLAHASKYPSVVPQILSPTARVSSEYNHYFVVPTWQPGRNRRGRGR